MKLPIEPRIVEATAAFLARAPDLSNADLLRRLARRFGEEELAGIMVTRFQRQVREPAVQLLRTRMGNGSTPARDADRGESPAAEREAPYPRASFVDEALLRAFRLGAEAGSRAEVVEAFRELETLRREVRRRRNGRGN